MSFKQIYTLRDGGLNNARIIALLRSVISDNMEEASTSQAIRKTIADLDVLLNELELANHNATLDEAVQSWLNECGVTIKPIEFNAVPPGLQSHQEGIKRLYKVVAKERELLQKDIDALEAEAGREFTEEDIMEMRQNLIDILSPEQQVMLKSIRAQNQKSRERK